MPTLAIYTADQWTRVQIIAAQSNAAVPLDFSVGSNPLALAEANTSVALYQQASILQVLAASRAATATGSDLDSWMADYAFYRLPATFNTGVAQLTRDTTTALATVAAGTGATVLSSDGLYAYQIVADTNQTAYNASTGLYTAPIGQASILVTVKAQLVGSAPNIAIGAQLLIGDGVSGFDTAQTISGFANGMDAETDPALRARFILYIQSLSRSTLLAIASAVANTQTGIKYTILNNTDSLGNYNAGNVQIFVDDGSGNPPDSLIAAVDANVAAVIGATISRNVTRPQILYAVVSFSVLLSSGVDPTQLINGISTTVSAYINGLNIGQSLSLTRLSNVVYDYSPYVANVEFVTINGQQADLIATASQVIKLNPNGLVVNVAAS